jgi:hypothetical protein
MYPRSVHALQADALFASTLQRGDELSVSQIRRAIAVALDVHGGVGCAGRVAQEFGDHPEAAAVRMRWARATLAALDGQSGPRIRRMAHATAVAPCASEAHRAGQARTGGPDGLRIVS